MDQLPSIIGLTGLAGSGKDTVADLLISKMGGYTYSFANPIRAMLNAGFGIDMNDPYWKKRKEEPLPQFGKSPREMMQTLGTEWGRELVSDDIWLVMANIKLMKHGFGMIIPDVRFENEAAWIRDRGGTLLHVTRKNIEPVTPHSSEGGVKAIPGEIYIPNDGTLQDLQDLVDGIVDGWNET